MPKITADVIEASIAVRGIEASGKFTAKRIDHYTLEAGGQRFNVTAYRELEDPKPAPGQQITGELLEPDKWDKDRLKFRAERDGSAPSSAGAGAVSSGGSAAPALSLEEQRRWYGLIAAGLYMVAKAQLGRVPEGDFDTPELDRIARGFVRIASSEPEAFSDVPGDTADLPPAGELAEKGYESPTISDRGPIEESPN